MAALPPPSYEKFGINSVIDLKKAPLIQVMGYNEKWPICLREAGFTMTDASFLSVDNSLLAFELAVDGVALRWVDLRSRQMIFPASVLSSHLTLKWHSTWNKRTRGRFILMLKYLNLG